VISQPASGPRLPALLDSLEAAHGCDGVLSWLSQAPQAQASAAAELPATVPALVRAHQRGTRGADG